MLVYLSKHFQISEFTLSDTAKKRNIDNTPTPDEVGNLLRLCDRILEPLRAKLDKPIRITSGYRCPELNKAVGGVPNSAHIQGLAADIQVKGVSVEELFNTIARSELPYDQVIQEFDRWVHVAIADYEKTPRRQALRATRQNGKTVYVDVGGDYAE